MNRVLSVYTELDSIYDSRRGILQWMITEGIQNDADRKATGDRLWELNIQKNYQNRRLDLFEYPQFKINRERFEAAYQKRSVGHWLMFYPTNFLRKFVRMIIEMEGLSDKPIDIKGVDLYVNIFPYELDTELREQFVAHAKSALGNTVNVKILNHDVREATTHFYEQFNYVFKYDLLLSKDYEQFMNSLKDLPIPETAFIVPDILVKETEDLTGTISNRIFAMSVLLSPFLKLIPVSHQFYDAPAA